MKHVRRIKTTWFAFVVFVLVFDSLLLAASPAELVSTGRVDEAILALNREVHSHPENAEAYALLCRVYYLVQDWDNATVNGERALQLNPNIASSHLWLGRAYGEKALTVNPVQAYVLARKVVREFERAYQLDSMDWKIQRDLAEFYVEAPLVVGGGERKAERLASQIEPGNPAGAKLIRAMIAVEDKHWSEAERQYRAAIEASGGAAAPWLELARYYRGSKRWDLFEDAVHHALNSSAKLPEDLFEAGELMVNAGRMMPQAIEVLRAYLGGTMDEYGAAFRAHYFLGQALEKQGDRHSAIGEYRSAVSLANNFQPAQEALRRLGA